MKKFILLPLFLVSTLSAEFSFEDLEKYVRQQHFENEIYRKISTTQEDYYFYKGKSEAYQEMIDYIGSKDEINQSLQLKSFLLQ